MHSNEPDLISIQPYFVLASGDFCQHIMIENGISHFFSFSNKTGKDFNLPLMVDGCSNLIFEYREGGVRTHFVGSTLEPRTFCVRENAEYFGVRLQPSASNFIKEIPPKEAVGKIIILDDLPSMKDFCKKMAGLNDFESRMKVFLEEYSRFSEQDCKKASRSELFKQIEELIIKRKGRVRISELEELSGYSSRYINKIFDSELGMSTKQLCSSIKFQFLLDDINKGQMENLTAISSEYHFYDQAHFIHEFKEFSGKTPSEYNSEVINSEYRKNIKDV